MAIGVLMVLIYVWSGESIIALVLSILTLFAALAVWQWQPWAVDSAGADGTGGAGPSVRPERTELLPSRGSEPRPRDKTSAWRSSFDITYDDRGVSGVAVGSQAPQMWSWSQIDDIDHHWCPLDQVSQQAEERLALRLFFPDLRNPEEPAQAWVMFGPDQQPEVVEREARSAWRDSKIKRSRLFEMTPQERTMKLADQLAPDRLQLTDWPRSPELLYQEVRRELLAGGEFCRLAQDDSFDDVLDAFDEMLRANQLPLITEAEADELVRADRPRRVAALYRTLDWVAEQRGFRMMFIEQRGGRSSDEFLIGLIPASSADDWDGQTVGSGSARVLRDQPT